MPYSCTNAHHVRESALPEFSEDYLRAYDPLVTPTSKPHIHAHTHTHMARTHPKHHSVGVRERAHGA